MNESRHIVKEFDLELQRLDNMIAELGGLAERQLSDAVDSLIRRDSERAQEIVSADERLDELEREIDHLGIDMLIRRQPIANDLRMVIAALKTASTLERIGDYAKNIAKRTIALAQLPNVSSVRSVARMAERTGSQIKMALDAYLNRDPDLAEDVRAADHEIDSLHTSLFRELLTYMMEDPRNITACTHLLFIAKNLERMGDHATSVAENLLFLVHGQLPEGGRPKRDESHYTVLEPRENDETDSA